MNAQKPPDPHKALQNHLKNTYLRGFRDGVGEQEPTSETNLLNNYRTSNLLAEVRQADKDQSGMWALSSIYIDGYRDGRETIKKAKRTGQSKARKLLK